MTIRKTVEINLMGFEIRKNMRQIFMLQQFDNPKLLKHLLDVVQ